MKRKLLFSIIPLCLSLVACNASNKAEIDNGFGTEGTEKCDDLFLDADIKYLDPVNDDTNVKVGIQAIKGEVTTSIRFIGLVTLNDSNKDGKIDDNDFTVGRITWNRELYNANGVSRRNQDIFKASKVYKSIGASGSEYTIEEYNQEHNTTYTHFATYIFRDIPNDQGKAVIGLSFRSLLDGTSKRIYTTVDQTTCFTTSNTWATGSRLIRKTASGFNDSDTVTSYSPAQNSQFRYYKSNNTISDGESFLLVVKDNNDYFHILGYSKLLSDSDFTRDGESEFIKAEDSNVYDIGILRDGSNSYDLGTPTGNLFVRKSNWGYTHEPIFSVDKKTCMFGLYPFKRVTDNGLIIDLDNLSGPNTGSLGWYTLNGKYYTKVSANINTSSGTPTFDGGDAIENNKSYWFECEPIIWKVLNNNNGDYLLLSQFMLDADVRCQEERNVNNVTIYPNNYKESNIRIWLNGEFYDKAFWERYEFVIESEVDNSLTSTGQTEDPYICDNTLDNVFTLSYLEYQTYLPNYNDRKTTVSEYARCRHVNTDSQTQSASHTIRTPAANGDGHYFFAVNSGGGIFTSNTDYQTYADGEINNALRPAITIHID